VFGSVSGALGIENQTGFAGLLFQQSYANGALTLTLSALGGDANLDSRVDIADFAVLASNFNSLPPQNWLAGNFNADMAVDIADFALLAANFNLGTGARLVPEPCGAALLAGVVALFGRRGQRRACGVR
jgi:hypothetical protein